MEREEICIRSSVSCGSGSVELCSTCQDCGNKAKRECGYKRCRTCCNSRGFHCPTHVHSTWVPLSARRRLRLIDHHHNQSSSSSSHAAAVIVAAECSRPPPPPPPPPLIPSSGRSQLLLRTHSSGVDTQSFPAEVNCLATFRRVRMSSDDKEDADQYAYQTSVSIGGHVFKGILYDQGSVGRLDSSAIDEHRQVSRTTSGAGDTTSGTPARALTTGTVDLLHHPPPSLYSGMQFFPRPRQS